MLETLHEELAQMIGRTIIITVVSTLSVSGLLAGAYVVYTTDTYECIKPNEINLGEIKPNNH